MIHFILTILALLIQMYSIHLARKNTESDLRYSFWYNILSAIIGVGTSFTTEFIPGSTITANNESFVITSIANNNLMTVNQFPSSPFTNIRIYK